MVKPTLSTISHLVLAGLVIGSTLTLALTGHVDGGVALGVIGAAGGAGGAGALASQLSAKSSSPSQG